MTTLILAAHLVLAASPMADVWPYKAQLQADGAIEYVYDLTPVKASPALADARDLHGADAVAAFLKSLPKEARVKLAPGYAVSLRAVGGLEAAPVVSNFALVSEDAFLRETALGKKSSAKLRPALHPDEPHLILSADVVVTMVRDFEEAALAASELELEPARRSFWNSVISSTMLKLPSTAGDSREGAISLIARVAAATSCLDSGKVNPAVLENSELKTATAAEISKLTGKIDLTLMSPPWADRAGLSCAWVRDASLAIPFENSRAGTAAVLTMVELLDRSAKLSAAFDAIRTRRNVTIGQPILVNGKPESFNLWRAHATGKADTLLDALNEFIEALPADERAPGALLNPGSTPVGKFINDIEGAARSSAADELASAAEEGRLALKNDTWPLARDAAAVAIALKEKGVEVDSTWHERQLGLLSAELRLPHQAGDRGDRSATTEPTDRTDLKVRLNVPPSIELEPSPALLNRLADSVTQLAKTIQTLKLQSLNPVWADGSKDATWALQEANRLASLLRGLSEISQSASATSAEALVARRYLASWKADPRLKRDIRASAVTPGITRAEHQHVAIAGVGRRQVSVGFASPAKAELIEPNALLLVTTDAEQTYIVPSVVAVTAPAPREIGPLKVSTLRKMFDASTRKPEDLEGALLEHLHAAP